MTETIVGLIGDRPGDKRRWPSIGRPGFCYQAQIRDKQNNEVPDGVVGCFSSDETGCAIKVLIIIGMHSVTVA